MKKSRHKPGRLAPIKRVPDDEAWLYKNPAALAGVRRGLRESAQGKTCSLGSFAKGVNSFLSDFAALEKTLARQRKGRAVITSIEQMIVELGLTENAVTKIDKKFRRPGFAQALAALRRHRLLPKRPILWAAWLKRYRRKRERLLMRSPRIGA